MPLGALYRARLPSRSPESLAQTTGHGEVFEDPGEHVNRIRQHLIRKTSREGDRAGIDEERMPGKFKEKLPLTM